MSVAAGKIVERIRRFRPQIVLTFAMDGSLNVHADHTIVSAITSAAFHWAARAKRYPEQELEPWQADRLYLQSTDFMLPDREPQLQDSSGTAQQRHGGADDRCDQQREPE